MPTEQLYVRIRGRILGPIPIAKATEMARNGRIQPKHEVSFDRTHWQRAAMLPVLFPESQVIEPAAEPTPKSKPTPWEQIKLEPARPPIARDHSYFDPPPTTVNRESTRDLLKRAANKNADVEDVPTYLVGSIFCTLCCCLPGGIIAIIYAIKTGEYLKKGDVHEAKVASSYAYLWITISVGTWVLMLIVTLIINLVLRSFQE
ncbi:MAG: CD225/dispanin family protein [Planctomycetota bacterium]